MEYCIYSRLVVAMGSTLVCHMLILARVVVFLQLSKLTQTYTYTSFFTFNITKKEKKIEKQKNRKKK